MLDISTGLGLALAATKAAAFTSRALMLWNAAYVWPRVVGSEQRTHVNTQAVPLYEGKLQWNFHLPHNT